MLGENHGTSLPEERPSVEISEGFLERKAMRQAVEEEFEVGEEWGDFDEAVKERARHFLTFP